MLGDEVFVCCGNLTIGAMDEYDGNDGILSTCGEEFGFMDEEYNGRSIGSMESGWFGDGYIYEDDGMDCWYGTKVQGCFFIKSSVIAK